MKHAFLIMCHQNFHQVERLTEYLDQSGNTIVIGVDLRFFSDALADRLTEGVSHASAVCLPLKIMWGGVTAIEATLKMLETASQFDCDYLHFLTGADVPLMTWDSFEAFMQTVTGKQLIEFAPRNYDFAYWKCNYFHFLCENHQYRTSKALKIISHGLVKVQQVLHIHRNRKNLKHGSAYFSITKQFALKLVSDKENICRNYKWTLGADEVFLQTYASRQLPETAMWEFEKPWGNGRYIDWERREGSSPHTFCIEDKRELQGVINSKYLFGRKFDEKRDSQIIDFIYSEIKK